VKHLRGAIKRGRYARQILRVQLASDPLSFFVSWPLISLATTRESKLVSLSVEPAYLELRVGRAQKFSAEAQVLPAAAKRRDRYSSPRDLTWNGKPAPSTQTYLHKQLDVALVNSACNWRRLVGQCSAVIPQRLYPIPKLPVTVPLGNVSLD